MKKFLAIVIFLQTFGLLNIWAGFFELTVGDVSPDGKKIIAEIIGGQATIWDTETLKQINSIKIPNNSTNVIKFLPDGKSFALLNYFENELRIYDCLTGKLVNNYFVTGLFQVDEIVFSPDLKFVTFLSGSRNDYKLTTFDLVNLQLISEKTVKTEVLAVNTTKNLLGYLSTENDKIVVVNLSNGAELGIINLDLEKIVIEPNSFQSQPVFELQFSGNGNKLFLVRKFQEPQKDKTNFEPGKFYNEILSFSVLDKTLTGKNRFEANQDQKEFEFNSKPEISPNFDGSEINLLDVGKFENHYGFPSLAYKIDGTSLKPLKKQFFFSNENEEICFPTGSKNILQKDDSGNIKVNSIETEKQIASLFPNIEGEEKLAVSRDNSKIAAVTPSGTIKIWNSAGVLQKKIENQMIGAELIEFSPNGQFLLTIFQQTIDAQEEKSLSSFRFWDVQTGALLREFNNEFYPNKNPGGFLLFSQNGERIFSNCSEGDAFLEICSWNVQTGELFIRAFPNQKENVNLIWFGDDQPISFLKSAKKPAENKKSVNYLWNFSDAALVAETDDSFDEFNENFVTDKKGTMVISQESYSGGLFFLKFRLNGANKINIPNTYFGDYSVNLNQTFLAKIEKVSNDQTASVFKSSELPTISKAKDKQIEHFITIKNLETDAENTLKDFSDEITEIILSDQKLISSAADKTIRVWDLATAKELLRLK